ncbi:MAG: IMP cyclohydrolase [Spirochaetales bacterium]|nr:IMP cyclohydrolase [Spirochaetales bacterium]
MSGKTDKKLSTIYREVHPDHFPKNMEIRFYDDQMSQRLLFEKVQWSINGEEKGLRYGENPDQEAALYKMINGNLCLGEVECINPGRYLASDIELLQSGKHPGKINITDADSAMNILKYLDDSPSAVIMKHNNPCGAAKADSLSDAYHKALMADRIAAFGGAVALNRPVDKPTAEAIAESYSEVVLAPDFLEGTVDILSGRKNLRIMRIQNMENLGAFADQRFVDFSSMMDGGIVAQWSYQSRIRKASDFMPAETEYKGKSYRIKREPTQQELDDLLFGWLVESGVTSNSVLYVKNGVTVGIGTGEQDRVGVAEIARDKAYRKMQDRLAWERHGLPWHQLEDPETKNKIIEEVRHENGGLKGGVMISDAFFPFRDGVDVGIHEGIRAVVQPGGSLRDFESIEACNENDVSMVFTGQRSFRH